MVEVTLPRETEAKELLDLLEESAKELQHKTERNPWDYVIVPGSVKKSRQGKT